MGDKPLVVVALSGGVDSSVSAALLVKAGYPVVGMMLRLWNVDGEEDRNRCCTPDAMAQARRVAGILDIPFYAIDGRDIFYQEVVQPFIHLHQQGVTPNPCILCNRKVRWGYLMQQAQALGAEFLATGHYAQLQTGENGKMILSKGKDESKDQSYVLSMLSQEQLSHTLLPVGGLLKSEVRQLATSFGLPTASRPDSQDLCFLGDHDYRWFLKKMDPGSIKPGVVADLDGKIIGEHKGLAYYTIGQRKGLGFSADVPYYVIEKRVKTNTLVVGPTDSLGKSDLVANHINWISGVSPLFPFRAQLKIRYKASPAWGMVEELDNGCVKILFDSPLRDITPGQALVFYNRDIVLGGGTIGMDETNPA